MSKKYTILIVDAGIAALLDNQNAPVGGASVQAYSWVKGLQKYVKLKLLSDSKENTKSNIVHLYPEGLPFKKNLIVRMIHYLFLIRKEKPTHVFVTIAGLNTFIWGIVCFLTNTTYIQRISNDIVYDADSYRKNLGLIKFVLSRIGINFVDCVLCQNKYQYNNLVKVVDSEKVHIVKNPFYTKRDKTINTDNNSQQYVSWVGLFQYQKNLEELYKITLKLPDIQFKVAGTSINKVDSVTLKYLEKLKTLDNVEFVGLLDRKDIIDFIAHSKCLLNTSRYEGYSNTYLEAFSVGTPVITRSKTDPDNVIRSNSLGLVADTYEELPQLIESAFSSDKDYSKATKEYMNKYHGADQIASDLLSILERRNANK